MRNEQSLRPQLSQAIGRAKYHLAQEAEAGFVELRHEMRFPRAAGFSGPEVQVTDIFARAVLTNVLLDTLEIDNDEAFRAFVSKLARREAEHVAAARLAQLQGGWSYFPELPELPPDLDSLSAALLLFCRVEANASGAAQLAGADHPAKLEHLTGAGEFTRHCDAAIGLAIDQMREDDSIATWLISEDDPPARRQLMQLGVTRYWGGGADVDVCAHFFYSLFTYDKSRYEAIARRGARYVDRQQLEAGSWDATWYHGSAYAATLCIRLLRALGTAEASVSRAVEALQGGRRPDGGWGTLHFDAQETALALWALALAGLDEPASAPSLQLLLDQQDDDGSWPASPWIKMDVGRASKSPGRILSFGSSTLATAFCLRSLVAAQGQG